MGLWDKINRVNEPGTGLRQFENARGLTLSDTSKTITISEINNKRIQVLDSTGQHIHRWPIEINGTYPCPLDVERVNENVLASVVGGYAALWQCPDVTDFSGVEVKLLKTFGGREMVFPRAIVQNSKEQFLVSDVGKHRVTLHDKENDQIIRSFGSFGDKDNAHFNWPYYMCIDDKQRLAVSDSHNQCVKLFDSKTLEYISCFGKDKFTCPLGVCCSVEKGSFFVSDYDSKSLLRFSLDGKFMEYVDKSMDEIANQLAFFKNGNLVVSNYNGFTIYEENKS